MADFSNQLYGDVPAKRDFGAEIYGSEDTPSAMQTPQGNLIDAVAEPILSLGSGMLAKPVGDLAGLAKGAYDMGRLALGYGQQGPNAEEAQKAFHDLIQYHPTTQVGASKWNPLNAIPNAIGGAIGLLQPDAVTGEKATTLGGMTQNAIREAIPQAIGIAGVKYGPGISNSVGEAAKRGAQSTMVNALKATPGDIMSGDAALAAQELLKRGVNPNTAGVVELSKVIDDLHGQVESTIAGSTASVSKQSVIDSLQRVKDSFMYKPNLPTNQARIAKAGEEFAGNPVIPTNSIPVQTAQKLKRGYQKSVAEDYGVESTAGLEANKQIAQSLRQQIESAHPEVGPLNAEQASLITALKVIERRAAMAQNEGLVPHVSPIGGATAQAAMILNRNPWLRANLAQGLNKVGNFLSKTPEVPTAPQSRIVPINKDIPYSGLPAVPGSMVIPQSWREGINAKMERSPLPAIPDQLLPLSEQYPQGIPIGAAEGRMPQKSTPLPKLYPDNPLMQMADEPITTKKISDLVEEVPFKLKLDVANDPLVVKATHDFIDQAANLKEAIAAETNGFKRGQLEAKLRGTEREFMAGWKELGFKNEAQLRDLTQKLYQTGGETQRGIVKTKSLKDLMQ